MTVNDGLPPEESSAYDPGHADVDLPAPAGHIADSPTEQLPVAAAIPADQPVQDPRRGAGAGRVHNRRQRGRRPVRRHRRTAPEERVSRRPDGCRADDEPGRKSVVAGVDMLLRPCVRFCSFQRDNVYRAQEMM